ncbi:MAG: GNAT family N-acetyltransferase [Lachnospiraceae bacterium]|nr:GNAT family N-acetyltransferase [Lachnospiraceae bacterium]
MNTVKDYMRDDKLRHELNDLTDKTFGFDFESWVSNGYFQGDYIPYSLEETGRMLSNASANIMDFEQCGEHKRYIQIGTVMTDESKRKLGLASSLIKQIIEAYKMECDGFYLFANLSALGFYKKMGFEECMQYRYSLKREVFSELDSVKKGGLIKVEVTDKSLKKKYLDYVKNSAVNAALDQKNKYGLQLFYTADFENVYYSDSLDCFVVIDRQDDTIMLQSIIAKKEIDLKEFILQMDLTGTQLQLGFAPLNRADLFDAERYDGEDDYRLMILGKELRSIEEKKLYFPELSHA